MDDWPHSHGDTTNGNAAANGSTTFGSTTGGGIDKTIYQNLVEMIPLMESFMEQKGNRRHAAMVYTPTPTPGRDGSVRKVAESPVNAKKNKQQRPISGKQQPKVDADEARSVVWEEQENVLRRVEDPPPPPPPAAAEKLDREQLMQLQGQIDALQTQLQEKDGMLRVCESEARAEAARQADIQRLQSEIQKLQQKVWDREEAAETLKNQLAEKEAELVNTQSLVERMQIQLLKKNNAASSMAEELNELRMQVAAFQYQAELRSISLPDEEEELEVGYEDPEDADEEEEQDEQSRDMETMRRMYLAAVIAAKEKPGDESILLAAELRRRLQSLVPVTFVC